jgi:RimJ/RimL family protein N-acetyltransferase
MGWRPFADTETKRFLQAVETRTLPRGGDEPPAAFSIVDAEQARPVGYVVLKGIDSKRGSAELGIAIMDRRYRQKGCGSEALRLAAGHAFDQLGLKKIGLTVFPSNVRAIGAYRKAGFENAGVLPAAWTMPDGRTRDMLVMVLKRSDWAAARKKERGKAGMVVSPR